MAKLYYESSYGRSLSHADSKDHKYVYKKMVNGKWRYYYDDDDKPDKGLSYKKMDKWKMENDIAITAPGVKTVSKKNTTYSLSIDGVKGRQQVSKDEWDNAGTGLYYKNEPVKNIAKRTVSDIKKSASKQIDKGQKFITSTLNKAEKGIKGVVSKVKKKKSK